MSNAPMINHSNFKTNAHIHTHRNTHTDGQKNNAAGTSRFDIQEHIGYTVSEMGSQNLSWSSNIIKTKNEFKRAVDYVFWK